MSHPESAPDARLAPTAPNSAGAMEPRAAQWAATVKGFMPMEEGLALNRLGRLAVASGLGPLLEVGTYCGKSAIYLGDAARAGGGLLVSVDHHRGSEELQAGWPHHDPEVVDPATGRIDTLPWARQAVVEAGLEDHVIIVVGSSLAVASLWSTPLALLFIDGGHGADVAWGDYRAWAPKVALGGWLAIHDVYPDPADGGGVPFELYQEALRSGAFEEETDAGAGSLRVLRRGR